MVVVVVEEGNLCMCLWFRVRSIVEVGGGRRRVFNELFCGTYLEDFMLFTVCTDEHLHSFFLMLLRM